MRHQRDLPFVWGGDVNERDISDLIWSARDRVRSRPCADGPDFFDAIAAIRELVAAVEKLAEEES